MKFRDFSKNLSNEIENLFATLGDNQLPEDAHRLDESISMDDFMKKIKEMDTTSPSGDQD